MSKPKASRPHMPGYGIAEANGGKGLLSWAWAKQRLEEGRTYFIATADSTGKPHLMPVWGVWFNDTFFFSTGNRSRKARNLAHNAYCSIATEIDFKKRPRKKNQIKDSLILQGMAELTDDLRTRKKFSTTYQDKYGWDMEGFSEPIYRVRPKVVFGLTNEFTLTATRWIFDE
ncbi:MAG TPA: pyridoxamine 5'-phosphate oxidase family protein [Pyrinomonadaceae bacterium]|nr:pyridoxamine 5'-phosphate oxidase family protein [Pyrinomonadaceae bacterium]